MKHLESKYETHDGLSLFLQAWIPIHPKAAVFLVHGLGEHSSRYLHVAERLTENDIAVFTFDGRGHGKSSQPKPDAYFSNYEDYLKDIDALYNKAAGYLPKLPIFIYGHSMGGVLVATYVIKYKPEPRGIILSAAALKPAVGTSKILITVSSLISKYTPKLKVLKLNPDLISHDKKAINDYNKDPLVYHEAIPARTAYEVLRMMRKLEEKAATFSLPVLIMHGSEDKVTNPEGSGEFFRNITSQDKTLIPYPGLYHELHNELEKEEVIKKIISWMKKRIGE